MADPVPAGRAEGRAGTGDGPTTGGGEFGGMADPEGAGGREQSGGISTAASTGEREVAGQGYGDAVGTNGATDRRQPGPTNGLWRDADWLYCRDGKWRPVEPGTFPLVDGTAARVGRLRGYGNAINAEVATAFIEAFILTARP